VGQDLTYVYNAVGDVVTITDALGTGSRTFEYDDLRRLVNATGTFGPNQASANCDYVYDDIGNVLNKCGVTFTYGDSLHPSGVTSTSSGNSYSYDANGNMLTGGNRTLVWDIDNRPTSVNTVGTGLTAMEYDYAGMRVKKDAPTGLWIYPFKEFEIDPSGTPTKFIRVGEETIASKKGTEKYFYHDDHLGGVNVITDIIGGLAQLNEYDPWGGISRSEGNIDMNHRFTGQELDAETGLYYYDARYYDAEISRFVSPDPTVPEPGDPQSLNRYSYVLNNPQKYIDPSGFEPEDADSNKSTTAQQLSDILRVIGGLGQVAAGAAICTTVAGCVASGPAIALGLDQILAGLGHRDSAVSQAIQDSGLLGRDAANLIDTILNVGASLGVGGFSKLASSTLSEKQLLEKLTQQILGDKEVLKSFANERFRGIILKSDVTVSKVFGGDAEPIARFLSRAYAAPSRLEAIENLRLPAGNLATNIAEIIIPKGTPVFVGKVAFGNGPQYYVPREYRRTLILLKDTVRELK
jgi:RHS repeat-associated protein